MATVVAERIELARLCYSKDWSKAIRVLDSLLSRSCVIQDLCNRAFCYSQLELHKHVIKDCDKALKLDPTLLQAYILKGRAFSALGKKEEALSVWQQGYEYSVSQSADLKQLLELEDLLRNAKQSSTSSFSNAEMESAGLSFPVSKSSVSVESSEASKSDARSNGKVEPCGKSSDLLEVDNRVKKQPGPATDGNKVLDSQSRKIQKNQMTETNGRYEKTNGMFGKANGMCDKFAGQSLSGSAESCIASSLIDTDSNGSSEVGSSSIDIFDIHSELVDEDTRSKKLCVARISKNKSINVDFRLSRGIAQVNDGNYDHAISIFDKILLEDPDYAEALIGRGTAYAFQRELHTAIADFTNAIKSNPSAGEAWKRRGQARAALGESAEAISDLTKALEFEPNSVDILHERGIVNFKFKDYEAAVKDLTACVNVESDNKSAYTYLGLSLSSLGEYERAEEAHMKAIQIDRSFLEAWTHLTQFYQDMANSEKALQCLHKILQIDGRFAKAYHLRGLLHHGMGEHRNAIKELSVGLSIESSNIECLYLRASCYHAIGEFKEAVKDYDAALDLELDSMEKFVLQCLAFYQKEIALYTASKYNAEFSLFDLDGDIDPLFKEYWCKRLHPKNVCEKVYRQPPLRDSLRKGKLKKQEFVLTKQKTTLLQFADSIGKKIQYHCPGFLPNRRQYRMAGLAAIEIAQKVSKVWRLLQNEWKHSNKGTSKHGKKGRRKEKPNTSQNRGGAGCSTSSFFETSVSYSTTNDRSFGHPSLSWHDVYALAVKWRQISEPCDPVVWVNKLSEEFNSGFGSHTPLTLGQAKVVRYYPNFQRALNVAKEVMKINKYVRDKMDNLISLREDEKLEEVERGKSMPRFHILGMKLENPSGLESIYTRICLDAIWSHSSLPKDFCFKNGFYCIAFRTSILKAESCSDLYRIVGGDFWLAMCCKSTAVEGKDLEGTRITLVKSGNNGFDFAIKTPCTPARWDDFEVEMTFAWEALCDAYCGENFGSTEFDMLENVREAILRMAYYWYNFTPLCRGSAVVGFVVLLGLFLAANMEFTGSIPAGVQVDWDAILESDPNNFVSSVKSWMYPCLKINTSWKGYPDVTSTFETTGSVFAALSTYSD